MESTSEERRFSPTKPNGPYDRCPDCGGWKAEKAYRCRACSPKIREAAERRWKDNPSATAARSRTRSRYPLPDYCERCMEARPVDRHHLDGDPSNNVPENVLAVCRRCHMQIDGRWEKFVAAGREAAIRSRTESKPCSECGRRMKPLRKGLCGACNERRRRREAKNS